MKAIAFDLGDTLVEYEGMPLNWEAHYAEALAELASFLRITPSTTQIERGCEILRRYNTRLHPRTTEAAFADILVELQAGLNHRGMVTELDGATAFFRIFRQRLRSFPDSLPAITKLRRNGWKIGVFTDVPYGMPEALVMEDVATTSLTGSFDILLTSRTVGFRKPSPATLAVLAGRLSCRPEEMAHVGNERKDVEVARAFGCQSILLDRTRHGADWGQDLTVASLTELPFGCIP